MSSWPFAALRRQHDDHAEVAARGIAWRLVYFLFIVYLYNIILCVRDAATLLLSRPPVPSPANARPSVYRADSCFADALVRSRIRSLFLAGRSYPTSRHYSLEMMISYDNNRCRAKVVVFLESASSFFCSDQIIFRL